MSPHRTSTFSGGVSPPAGIRKALLLNLRLVRSALVAQVAAVLIGLIYGAVLSLSSGRARSADGLAGAAKWLFDSIVATELGQALSTAISHPSWMWLLVAIAVPAIALLLTTPFVFASAATLAGGGWLGTLGLLGVALATATFLLLVTRLHLFVATVLESICMLCLKCWALIRGQSFSPPFQAQAAQRHDTASQVSGQEAQSLIYPAVAPSVSLDRLHGMRELKDRLLQAGRSSLESGARPTNGILLHGSPGNGKTIMAEALAGSLGVRYIGVSIADIQSKWVGQTTEQLVAAFRDACAQAPCVLLFDEVDSLIRDRENDAGNSEDARTTNAFLTEVVRVRGHGVVVIAATNYLDRLDTAAIRDGRFDYKIEVTPPDEPARRGLLLDSIRAHAPRAAIAPGALESASRRWDGFSVARILAVGRAAATAASGGAITRDCLLAALRSVQAERSVPVEDALGIEDLSLSDEQQRMLQSISWRMGRMFEAEDAGATVPDGVLFYGPPGTGKTSGVKALAKATGWALFVTSGPDLAANPARIESLVRTAEDARPSIIFIDEADEALCDRRYGTHASLTSRLLTAMDGASTKTADVLFIAATNHPERIDPALLRGGRFTEKVEFRLPGESARRLLIRRWLEERGWSLADHLDSAVAMLDGLSPADVKAVLQVAVNSAAASAALHGTKITLVLQSHHLRQALATVAPAAS